MYFIFKTAAGHSGIVPAVRRAHDRNLNIVRAATEWFIQRGPQVFLRIAFFWVVFSSPVFAQETSAAQTAVSKSAIQSVDFFIAKAIENNHQYKAVQAKMRQGKKLEESETMVVEDPMLSLGLVNVPLSSWPAINTDRMSGVGFMLSQKIALPGESESRHQMAGKEYLARAEAAGDLELNLAWRVRQNYYELNYLYRKLHLLNENLDSLKGIVSVARAMVRVNKMNSAHLLKLDASVSQLQSQIQATGAMIFRAESAMEELTLIKAPYEFFESPLATNTDTGQINPVNISLPSGFAFKNHPRYKMAEAMLEKSTQQKKNEIAKYFPALTLSAEYMLKDPIDGQAMSGEDMISLRVTAPLPLFFPIKQSKKVQAAEEGINEARENLQQTGVSLTTAWQGEHEMAERLLDVYWRYHEDTLPKYYASYKAQLGSLSSGKVTLLDVLDAYRAYLDVSIKEAETYRDLQKSIAMLKYLAAQTTKSHPAKAGVGAQK